MDKAKASEKLSSQGIVPYFRQQDALFIADNNALDAACSCNEDSNLSADFSG
jgi:hypothetical protein